jgi:hypothetical protein
MTVLIRWLRGSRRRGKYHCASPQRAGDQLADARNIWTDRRFRHGVLALRRYNSAAILEGRGGEETEANHLANPRASPTSPKAKKAGPRRKEAAALARRLLLNRYRARYPPRPFAHEAAWPLTLVVCLLRPVLVAEGKENVEFKCGAKRVSGMPLPLCVLVAWPAYLFKIPPRPLSPLPPSHTPFL